RLHDAFRFIRVGNAQQLGEHRRNDLPGQPELVLEPAAALDFRASRGELFPIGIHLRLRLAIDHKRYCFRELEMRAAIEGDKRLTLKLKLDRHYRAGGPGPGVVVPGHLDNLRIRKNRSVESGRLFRLMIEPQERGDFLNRHGLSPSVGVLGRLGRRSPPLPTRRMRRGHLDNALQGWSTSRAASDSVQWPTWSWATSGLPGCPAACPSAGTCSPSTHRPRLASRTRLGNSSGASAGAPWMRFSS